ERTAAVRAEAGVVEILARAARAGNHGVRVYGPAALEPGALERCRADVVRLWPDLRDRREEELAQARVVLLEDLEHRLVGDKLRSVDAHVVIRDHRDVRVAELELAGEVTLGVSSHVDHVPAHLLEPGGLCPGGETWPLDDDHRPATAHRDPELAGGVHQDRAQ